MKAFVFILPILAVLYTSESYAASGDKEFEQGLKAFKKGDFNSALAAFRNAEQKGLRTSALDYNLGVVNYKLGKLDQAAEYFSRLTGDRKLAQLAHYNLGLIAERQDNKTAALENYRKSRKGSDKDIMLLSEYRMSKLSGSGSVSSWYGLVSVAVGYDDNVNLISNNSPTQTSDTYTEIFAYASYLVNQQLSFVVTYDGVDYMDVDIADFSQLSGGTDYRLQLGGWQLIPGLRYARSTLNSNDYQNIIDLRFVAKKELSRDSKLTLRSRYSDIQSRNSLYDYLEGSRIQLRADYETKVDAVTWRMRYQLELNDRQNLSTANYSPTRNTFELRAKYRLNPQWRLDGSAEFRNSQYDAAAGITREDDRLRLRTAANYFLNRDWDIQLRYTFTDNESNLAGESYTRNELQSSINYSF